MLMAYLTLITGLLISAVAIFYSVAGLTSIFSAAPLAIIIMGTVLEVSKLVATVWLKQNWDVAPKLLKGYLLSAVAILMFITSMGIFGFLSKAHSDQTLVSGDVQSKIAVYDEKIKTEKDNIEAARKALAQMDVAVDQTMARSTNEAGAGRAAQLRRTQAKERTQLQKEIADSQKRISALNDERAPIAAEVRKVEAEVGPIKYIAAFIYGDNPDANLLEKAVTWVIILIVVVFDPLAVMLLLASQYSFGLLNRKPEEETAEEFFDKAQETAKSIDEGYYVPPIVPPSSPLTTWTSTTTYGPEPAEDLDKINQELAEARVEPEIDIPEIDEVKDEVDDMPFRGKGLPPGMPMIASYIQPKVEDEPTVNIIHTADSMIIEDSAGTQEIPTHNIPELKKLIDQYGYTIENGVGKIHGIEVPENIMAELLDSSYVQNEEQKESSQWSKILNKTITEEEYLKAVQQKKDV
jgi:hypothetical protein